MKETKKITLFLFIVLIFFMCGCGSFWRGTAAGGVGGAAGAGATYELRAKEQLKEIEEDLEAGRISKEEYEIRKDQIKKDSLVY